MPINYKHYPPNWKTEIRPAILKRAFNQCENCGVVNGVSGFRENGKFYPSWGLQQEADIEDGKKIITIVLTVAHLNHDIKDNRPENLKALCQKCHLSHDAGHHQQTRKYGKNQNQMELL
jgi:hypothetical protein